MHKFSNRLGKFPLVALALAAGCGGAADPRLPVRDDAVPVLATLAGPGGAGSGQLRAGDLSGARAAYEAELTAAPGRLGALNDLAVSYAFEGHHDAARRLLDEVVANGSPAEQQAALVNLGELYGLEGNQSAAQAYLETARGLDPARPEPLYALALLASGRGDAAGARAALREALRLDEGSRAALAFTFPEERRHLDALLAEEAGDRAASQAAWRDVAAGRFPVLAGVAARRLGEL